VRRAEDARVFAVLSFKRPAFTLPPKLALRLRSSLVPAPAGALRAFTVANVDTAAAAGSGPEAGNRPCGPFAWKTTLQDGAGRAISMPPLSRHGGKHHRLRAGKHRAGRTRHAACEALRLPHAEAVRIFL
jgi:hypothetical protein